MLARGALRTTAAPLAILARADAYPFARRGSIKPTLVPSRVALARAACLRLLLVQIPALLSRAGRGLPTGGAAMRLVLRVLIAQVGV